MNEHRNVQRDINENNVLNFSTSLQRFGVQLAIVVSSAVNNPTMVNDCNYKDAVHYLCNKILQDSLLKKYIEVSEINGIGNDQKHKARKNVKPADILETVHHFNRLIDKLTGKLNAPILSKLKFASADSKKEKNQKKKEANSNNKSNSNNKPAPNNNPKPVSKTIQKEDGISLEVELQRGYGWIDTDIRKFLKKIKIKKYHFYVGLKIQSLFPLVSVVATLKTKDGMMKLNIRNGMNEYAIPAGFLEPNVIAVTVEVVYRISRRSTKAIKTTAKMNY